MQRSLLVVAALLAACTGTPSPGPSSADTPASTPSTDEAAPATQPTETKPEAPADPTVRAEAFSDPKAARAAVEGTEEPVMNELSGEKVGVNVTREEAGAFAGIPCGPMISLYDDTWGCELSEAWSDGHRTTRAGTFVPFHYETGHRAGIVLSALEPAAKTLEVGGVPCTEFVHLHPDGALSGCVLAKEHTFGTTALPAKTQLEVRADGSLQTAVIFEDVEIGDKTIPAGTVQFSADGSVESVNADWFGD